MRAKGHLIGIFATDPSTGIAESGTEFVKFLIACKDDKIKNRDISHFLSCSAWGQTARFIRDYFQRGTRVYATFEVTTRDATNSSGERQRFTDFIITDVMKIRGAEEYGNAEPIYRSDGAQQYQQREFKTEKNGQELPPGGLEEIFNLGLIGQDNPKKQDSAEEAEIQKKVQELQDPEIKPSSKDSEDSKPSESDKEDSEDSKPSESNVKEFLKPSDFTGYNTKLIKRLEELEKKKSQNMTSLAKQAVKNEIAKVKWELERNKSAEEESK